MLFLKTFENFRNDKTLLIVDVQKSFRKYFTEMYLHELKKYCKEFSEVYQIFDNHVDGKNVENDYLYDENPKVPVHGDLYWFPNQKEIIEKRYNYDVDVDFYKKVLDKKVYDLVKSKEDKKELKRGDTFPTKFGTHIVYIGNNHKWYHLPKKLHDLLATLKGTEVVIVGGADSECLLDIVTTAESLGVNLSKNYRFIYTANHCPI